LVFVKANNEKIILDSKKLLSAWGLILFNVNDIPTFWMGTEVDEVLMKVYAK